ncbi:hypothetical protein [Streptomyces vinaceus]|uniref:hypothetical protein n=1 Tax=Streptomyces vinaceus TaxID=1960 RepID=UPI0038244AA8
MMPSYRLTPLKAHENFLLEKSHTRFSGGVLECVGFDSLPEADRIFGKPVKGIMENDPDTGTMLLKRLDASRSRGSVADDTAVLQIPGELLAASSRSQRPRVCPSWPTLVMRCSTACPARSPC